MAGSLLPEPRAVVVDRDEGLAVDEQRHHAVAEGVETELRGEASSPRTPWADEVAGEDRQAHAAADDLVPRLHRLGAPDEDAVLVVGRRGPRPAPDASSSHRALSRMARVAGPQKRGFRCGTKWP